MRRCDSGLQFKIITNSCKLNHPMNPDIQMAFIVSGKNVK